MKPTLFVRGGALGDLVVTLGVLARLLAAGPVDVAVRRAHRALIPLVADPEGRRPAHRVGRIWDLDGTETLWMHGGRDPVGYGGAVAFSRSVATGLLTAGIAPVRAVDARVPAGVWAYDHFGGVLDGPVARPRLRVERPGPPRVLLAPGAGSPAKRWPIPRWAALAARLADLPVAWVAGPEEAGEAWPASPLRPDLPETARLAARSVWVGPDSGPGHLAAAAGARVVSLFGPTDPRSWAPPGASVVHLDASIDEVEARIRGIWESTAQRDTPAGPR